MSTDTSSSGRIQKTTSTPVEPLASTQQAASKSSVTMSAPESGPAANELITGDELIDFSTVSAEDSMTTADVAKNWQKIYHALGANSGDARKQVRMEFFKMVIKNSSSTRAPLRSSVTIGGRSRKVSDFIRDEVLPQNEIRRFVRSSPNCKELEAIARSGAAKPTMLALAKARGVNPDIYIAALDVADKFNLSSEEYQEWKRAKRETLRYSSPLEAPISGTAASNNDAQKVVPPAASSYRPGMDMR